MPYKIKEKKDKSFSVVNKDTGKVMSKGTTKTKAEKQIKAIYANMSPEHRLRHRISQLHDRQFNSPVHRAVYKMACGLLKKEEVYGGSWWNDAWEWTKAQARKLNFLDPEQYPVLNLVGTEVASDPVKYIGDAVKEFGLIAVEILAPELAPFIEVGKLVGSFNQPGLATEEDQFAHLKEDGVDEVDEVYEEPEDKSIGQDKTKAEKESMVERLDRVVEKIQEQSNKEMDANMEKGIYDNQMRKLESGIVGRHSYVDEPIRFPVLYNYDENSRPLPLAEWLLVNGVSGTLFDKAEFGSTYLNQKPYAFLDHPLNGGKLGKINYSKLGYSKY